MRARYVAKAADYVDGELAKGVTLTNLAGADSCILSLLKMGDQIDALTYIILERAHQNGLSKSLTVKQAWLISRLARRYAKRIMSWYHGSWLCRMP